MERAGEECITSEIDRHDLVRIPTESPPELRYVLTAEESSAVLSSPSSIPTHGGFDALLSIRHHVLRCRSCRLHELTHLVHLNHSKRFWSLVEQRCPDYREHERWLREYGPGLRTLL